MIEDLILPKDFDKDVAMHNLINSYLKDIRYIKSNYDGSEHFIAFEELNKKYKKLLYEIDNYQIKYDKEFWENVIELNKENLLKMKMILVISAKYPDCVYFATTERITPYIKSNNVELVNKQYKLLQEIFYDRNGNEKTN
jgi:hypothetical protein